MIDLMQAVQTAVFELLDGASGVADPVFQHVLENTDPPMHIIGNIETDNIGTMSEQHEEVSLEIVTVYRGPGRALLLEKMHRVRAVLDGAALSHAGVIFPQCRFLGGTADGPATDGITYAGIGIYKILAEPA